MKKIFKYILPVFMIIVFTTNVNAAMVCNNGKTTKITEKSEADPFGFDVTVPLCKWIDTGVMKSVGEFNGGFTAAVDFAAEKVAISIEDMSAKGSSTLLVPRCGDPKAKVRVTADCTMYTKIAMQRYTGKYDSAQSGKTCELIVVDGSNDYYSCYWQMLYFL